MITPSQGFATDPWRLLKKIRDVMGAEADPQQRLGQVVVTVANHIVAEVCSVYLKRAGEVLELFATHGLAPEAVHATRLRVGEGVVGLTAAQARPFNLRDAQKHPGFAYRPETGEELYRAMVTVPILRQGRVIGVLAVQNRAERSYTDEEVEALQNVAMVLAELVASNKMVAREEWAQVDGIAVLPLRVTGDRLAGGIGHGEAVLHEPHIVVDRMVSDDPEWELRRLQAAMAGLRTHLDRMHERVSDIGSADEAPGDILEAYRLIANDAGWLGRITEAVNTGLTAEAAVQKVHNDTHARMGSVSDPYLRERLKDLEDLANRLLQHLSGKLTSPAFGELPDDVIVVAHDLGPAELLDYDHARLRGLLLEEGSQTSHVAIVARALDIPLIGGIKDVMTKLEDGDWVAVDGDNAQAFVRPSEEVRDAFDRSLRARAEQKQKYAQAKDLPAETKDGVVVSLNVNAGLLLDVPSVSDTGADGIGLYRTEIPFMARSQMPDVSEQEALYRRIFEQAKGKPVVFRTLDVGGDKLLPYWGEDQSEENPAMGWRSIRITLDRPHILRQQFRALIRAADGGELNVMFPMIATVAELDQAKHLLNLELDREAGSGHRPGKVNVGAMLEVPSLFWQSAALLKRVDFISVGTNDLLQFLFAADRGNRRIAARYDTLSPNVLNFMRHLVVRCDAANVRLSVCGEMAGRPLEALGLLAVGVNSLSMTPSRVGKIKEMIRSVSIAEVTPYILAQLDCANDSLRQKLRDFARDHSVIL